MTFFYDYITNSISMNHAKKITCNDCIRNIKKDINSMIGNDWTDRLFMDLRIYCGLDVV